MFLYLSLLSVVNEGQVQLLFCRGLFLPFEVERTQLVTTGAVALGAETLAGSESR